LPVVLAERPDALSPRMMRIVEDLAGDWRRLDERIEGLSADITSLVEKDPACQRLYGGSPDPMMFPYLIPPSPRYSESYV
jgi:hypothetical protein